MSPIALTSPIGMGSSPGIKADPHSQAQISRRPSPWTDLAHSLSETSLPRTIRRDSIPHAASQSQGQSATSPTSAMSTPLSPAVPESSPRLSSSALREWDRLLLGSHGQAKRHHLIHPSTLSPPPSAPAGIPFPPLRHAASNTSLSAPKLAAERDKDGHIEYKLKLIDPTPERFERLVTQMLWRLKQGRNEAIYEIGLADDGTVIGLTRAEMDASLSTLEQMAAEVGATVLILKEIVLSGATTLQTSNPLAGDTSALSSSVSSSGYSGSIDGGGGGWTVRRPDLDESGQPRRGSRSISNGSSSTPGDSAGNGWGYGYGHQAKPGSRAWKKGVRAIGGVEKQVIFDQADLRDAEVSGEGGEAGPSRLRSRSESKSGSESPLERAVGEVDEDIPPFHLDLELEDEDDHFPQNHKDIVPTAVPVRQSTENPNAPAPMDDDSDKDQEVGESTYDKRKRKWKRWKKNKSLINSTTAPTAVIPKITPEVAAQRQAKASLKAARSLARKEQRRLELYKGDGMDPDWAEKLGYSGAVGNLNVPPDHPIIPHQPNRPSTLRLATPAYGLSESTSISSSTSRSTSLISSEVSPTTATESESESSNGRFVADLLHIPLDNLSLSFAEVQTVTDPSEAAYHLRRITPRSVSVSTTSTSTGSGSDSADDEEEEEVDEQTEYATSPSRELILRERELTNQPGEAATTYQLALHANETSPTKQVMTGFELICVEALVVRKTAEGVAGVGEWCEDGDDAWGFGFGDDGEDDNGDEDGLGEVDPDDTWGFE